MSSTTLCRGNVLSSTLIAPVITPAQVAAGPISALQTFPVAGLTPNLTILALGPQSAQTLGISIDNAYCAAPGVLSVVFGSNNSAALTPVAGAYLFEVIQQENSPLPTTYA
jgi:hypothetical protein